MTQDDGVQPLLWRSMSRHEWSVAPHKHKPIRLLPNALGPGFPRRLLTVSPQHRIVVVSPRTEAEVMVPARMLEDLPHIRRMRGKRWAEHYHLLLPRHSVIFAEGAPVESLYPGKEALEALSGAQKAALVRALGRANLSIASYGDVARPCPAKSEIGDAKRLLAPSHPLSAALAA